MVVIAHAANDKRISAAVSSANFASVDALSPEALRQLAHAARSFENDEATSVVVLIGRFRGTSAMRRLDGEGARILSLVASNRNEDLPSATQPVLPTTVTATGSTKPS
jgi:hypothetical protein